MPPRRAPRRPRSAAPVPSPFRRERAWVAALLAVHVALAVWGLTLIGTSFLAR